WDPNTNNTQDAKGHVFLSGKPVAGVRVRVSNGWVAAPTDKTGAFVYPVDNTLPMRWIITVADASGATIGGQPASAAQKAALQSAKGAVNVGYTVSNLTAKSGSNGTVVVSGRITYGQGKAPLPVGLYSYLLKGKI